VQRGRLEGLWIYRRARSSGGTINFFLLIQSARETVLEHEAHLRRTRALLAGIQSARTLTNQLANSGLTTAKAQLAVEIGEQLSTLAGAVEELAPLPKGVTTRQGR
jgi:hypothetical protein